MAFIPSSERQVAIARRFGQLHSLVFRLTGGRVGSSYAGTPVLVLHHVGRKSGEARTTPLVYLADGDDLVIAASKAGNPKNPAWYHNLLAAPDTEVEIKGERRRVHAAETTAEDRAALWPRFEAENDDFAEYAKAAGGRVIPLVRLQPR